VISITLPLLLPLQNVTNRQHWTRRSKAQKRLMKRIDLELPRVWKRIPIDPATVTFERYGTQVPDYGNMAGGAKDALDALVKLGLLMDDSPAHVTERYVFHKVSKRAEQRTRIIIEERT
jgi:Holliday junction resolvase RusA-like endonuclease